jgi:hypothetical protein
VANEITLTASLSCYKPSIMSAAVGRNISNILYSMSGSRYTEGTVLASHTAANAIPLGPVTSLGWAVFFNTDPNNAIQVYNNNSDLTHPFLQIPPQGFNVLTLYSGLVPYVLALSADSILEYLILSL